MQSTRRMTPAIRTIASTRHNKYGDVGVKLRSMEENLAQVKRALQIMVTMNQGMNGNGRIQNQNQFTRMTKVEFPKFSGYDVKGWIFRCNSLGLMGKILVRMCTRIGSFKDLIEMVLRMYIPKTLADAYSTENIQEATLEAIKKKNKAMVNSQQGRFGGGSNGYWNNVKPSLLPLTSSNSNWRSKPNTLASAPIKKQMTQKEYQEKRAQNLCFYCDQKYTPCHKCNGKFFSIVMSIAIISISSDLSKESVGTSTGRVILFGTIPTTILDTTPSVIPRSTYIDTALTPTSPDYTLASPDYSPASDTESDLFEDLDTPDTPPSPTHGTPFTEMTLSTQSTPVAYGAPRRRVMILAPGQPIPHDHFASDDSSSLASETSSDPSSDDLSDSSSDHSLPAPSLGMRPRHHLCLLVPSFPRSSAAISDRPSHDSSSVSPSRKRSRSPAASVPLSSPIPGALSSAHADLLPSPKKLTTGEISSKSVSLTDNAEDKTRCTNGRTLWRAPQEEEEHRNDEGSLLWIRALQEMEHSGFGGDIDPSFDQARLLAGNDQVECVIMKERSCIAWVQCVRYGVKITRRQPNQEEGGGVCIEDELGDLEALASDRTRTHRHISTVRQGYYHLPSVGIGASRSEMDDTMFCSEVMYSRDLGAGVCGFWGEVIIEEWCDEYEISARTRTGRYRIRKVMSRAAERIILQRSGYAAYNELDSQCDKEQFVEMSLIILGTLLRKLILELFEYVFESNMDHDCDSKRHAKSIDQAVVRVSEIREFNIVSRERFMRMLNESPPIEASMTITMQATSRPEIQLCDPALRFTKTKGVTLRTSSANMSAIRSATSNTWRTSKDYESTVSAERGSVQIRMREHEQMTLSDNEISSLQCVVMSDVIVDNGIMTHDTRVCRKLAQEHVGGLCGDTGARHNIGIAVLTPDRVSQIAWRIVTGLIVADHRVQEDFTRVGPLAEAERVQRILGSIRDMESAQSLQCLSA
ncbi:hypothetical protein Tco_0163498 [Tanacetum coccineum]